MLTGKSGVFFFTWGPVSFLFLKYYWTVVDLQCCVTLSFVVLILLSSSKTEGGSSACLACPSGKKRVEVGWEVQERQCAGYLAPEVWGKPSLTMCADSCGVNTCTMARFRLPRV